MILPAPPLRLFKAIVLLVKMTNQKHLETLASLLPHSWLLEADSIPEEKAVAALTYRDIRVGTVTG